MGVSAMVCLANGSEETEAVTVIDLLVRAGVDVTVAGVGAKDTQEIVCSRGVRLLADAPLAQVAGRAFDAIVLPGGVKGAEALRDSATLIDCLRRAHRAGALVAAICAAPALVLVHHRLFPEAGMTGFPALKDRIPAARWREQRVVYDKQANLLTSQGPGTAMEFALHIIARLLGNDKAAEVAAQLVLPAGMEDFAT
ncbi:protein deglycase YajL [Acerihabitans arboris]|uniref:Protein deglycase YajL n=1 Tax=Acerihabitans arboris TaxID=2691583 RepID=A0A845SIK2_9GAMM|nr:protein deglycase YajL [Acerihabitans arboris]NDL64993.1 protein deglycase YajL [Acerihabitans arboris]